MLAIEQRAMMIVALLLEYVARNTILVGILSLSKYDISFLTSCYGVSADRVCRKLILCLSTLFCSDDDIYPRWHKFVALYFIVFLFFFTNTLSLHMRETS